MLRSTAFRALRQATPALRSATAAPAKSPRAASRVNPLTTTARTFSSSPSRLAEMAAKTDVGGYRFNHTMLRVKNPDVSIDFYTRILGMEQIDRHDADSFSLIFLAYPEKGQKGLTAEQKTKNRSNRDGVLELTWNHGTEKEEGQVYASGNEDVGKGFGHIAISVDDLDAACARFTDLGVKFKKRPEEGKMRNIAFIYDPDGYWVEVIPARK